MKTIAIIPAGGAGTRFGAALPKQFLHLAGEPVLARTARALLAAPEINGIIVAAPEAFLEETEKTLSCCRKRLLKVVVGGATRQDSVARGIAALPAETDLVVVHDAARPLVEPELVSRCVEAAARHGAAILAVEVKDTLKREGQGTLVPMIAETLDRRGLWRAQTPQAAKADLLRRAYDLALKEGFQGTDEAMLLERAGIPVALVPGNERNIKITRQEDLAMAEALFGARGGLRIGHGFDAHRFDKERPLILGGVTIPNHPGLLGHSDADVVAHALMDAILGAAGLADIGHLFPDSDPRFAGANSLLLLAQVTERINEQGFILENADITAIAQTPKLAPHLPAMRENLARACKTETKRINLKATTTEQMGFTGRGEGMAAHAVVLLRRA